MGQGAVGLPSLTVAYAPVRRRYSPTATTSLNIVQRLGGPIMMTLYASFLAWRLRLQVAAHAVPSAYAFLLFCCIYVLTFTAATWLPVHRDDVAVRD
jgi:succinate dehydrogenase/fumarate reductase cytochrome b subunit